MPRVLLVCAVLLACGDEVPQTLNIPVRGLFTAASQHGEMPQGALVRAENVNVRGGYASPRRGLPQAIGSPASSVFPYRGVLVLHDGSTLSATDAGVTLATAYSGSYSAPTGRRMRFAEANGNLYLTTSLGIRKTDATATAPFEAGVPPGLDVQGSLTGASGIMPNDSAVAYRVVWGTRDANTNLVLGAPSGRAVITNSAGGSRDVIVSTSIPSGIDASRHFWQLYRTDFSVGAAVDPGDEMGLVYEAPAPATRTITQLSRAANVVTATSNGHGYATGQIVRVSPGGINCTHGVSFGASATRTTDHGATWSTAGITGLAATTQGLACKGDLYVAIGTYASARAYTSPDGLTWTARGSAAASTTYYGATWGNSKFVAVGETTAFGTPAGVGIYSADGITWTSMGIPSIRGIPIDDTGTSGGWRAITWTGSKFVAVGRRNDVSGFSAIATSSADGINWGPVVTVFSDAQGAALHGITWDGVNVIAVGRKGGSSDAAGTPVIYTSPDGAAWNATTGVTGTGSLYAAASSGTTVVAVGYGNSGTFAFYANTGSSAFSAASGVSGLDLRAVTWDGTNYMAAGGTSGGTAATAPSAGDVWTSRTSTIIANAIVGGGGPIFSAGEYALTGTTTNTFTYADAGADGTLVQNQTATPITAVVTDQIPSTFSGATLYTSPSQEGILASHYQPPAAKDVAVFKGSAFWLATTDRAALDFYMLATDAPVGVQANDTITINGLVFTAKASESIANREFQVFTAGTAAEDVQNTTASLVRVVNRAQGSPVYCRDMSGANDAPGHMQLTARSLGDSITVSVSRAGSWAFTDGTTKSSATRENRLMWSPQNQPDASQITAYSDVGAATRNGLRVMALRDSAWVLKEDGVWRLTGDRFDYASPPVLQPFDTTTEIVGAETAASLDNVIFVLSTKGVVQISDTGVTVISGPIRDQIDALLVEPLRSTVESVAFGVAYESEGKYLLAVPESSSDTQATRFLVYDHFESQESGIPTWTTWTTDAKSGTVNPADGKLYLGTSTNLLRERKTLDYTDFADAEFAVTVNTSGTTDTVTLADATNALVGDMLVKGAAVGVVLSKNSNTLTLDRSAAWTTGAGTVYRAIPTVTEFAPIIPGKGGWVNFHEVSFLYRYASGGYWTIDYASELAPSFESVPVYGTRDYGLLETSLAPFNLRTWVTRDAQRAARLKVRHTHSQARSPFALEGVSLIFTPIGPRLNR